MPALPTPGRLWTRSRRRTPCERFLSSSWIDALLADAVERLEPLHLVRAARPRASATSRQEDRVVDKHRDAAGELLGEREVVAVVGLGAHQGQDADPRGRARGAGPHCGCRRGDAAFGELARAGRDDARRDHRGRVRERAEQIGRLDGLQLPAGIDDMHADRSATAGTGRSRSVAAGSSGSRPTMLGATS